MSEASEGNPQGGDSMNGRLTKKQKGDGDPDQVMFQIPVEQVAEGEASGTKTPAEDCAPKHSTEVPRRVASYRDTLMQVNGGWEAEREEEDWVAKQLREDREQEEEDAKFEEGEDDPLNPNLDFPQEEYLEACQKWKGALIVKLMGKKVGARFLWERLSRLWRLKGQYRWIEMENGYFVVRFNEEGDYRFVLEEGPWIVLDHYVTVQRWKPMFDTQEDKMHKMAIWIRVPGLPVEFYTKKLLTRVGNKVGRTLKIDPSSLRKDEVEDEFTEKGKFARICVEVDLNKSFISKFRIKSRQMYVSYEGLHLICFFCGKYGHRKNVCPLDPNSNAPHQDSVPANPIPSGRGGVDSPVGEEVREQKDEVIFGNWMLVQKPSRGGRSGFEAKKGGNPPRREQVFSEKKQGKQNPVPGGSRFNALATVEEDPIPNVQMIDPEKSILFKAKAPLKDLPPQKKGPKKKSAQPVQKKKEDTTKGKEGTTSLLGKRNPPSQCESSTPNKELVVFSKNELKSGPIPVVKGETVGLQTSKVGDFSTVVSQGDERAIETSLKEKPPDALLLMKEFYQRNREVLALDDITNLGGVRVSFNSLD